MLSLSDLRKNYFELFELPVGFALDQERLGVAYRKLQGALHPDRYANAPASEQRLAVQYSALVNEAYATLRKPLGRALYLLELAGMRAEDVARQKVDGGFLIMQMELREKLESLDKYVDPEEVLDKLLAEIRRDVREELDRFASAYGEGDTESAARACVRIQYLDKLLREAEAAESELMDR